MDQIILHDRYRLLQRIGVGGMAYVYEAEDTLLKRRVAVKLLKQQYVEDAEFLRKFENEAQSAAALNHPNIVNIYDVGEDHSNGRPLHYIVMELIEGTTLKDAIRAQGIMPSNVIAKVGAQVARALQCAHDHGIIHRDIKPANILIMRSGDVKVADFGIARISSSATVTYTNSILGTVHYISPEQAKGHITSQKSDIYSLGVVMYEMATGQVPFDADNAVGVAIKHIQQEPIPPSKLNPNLDKGLESIILKCMEKNPDDRFQDARELIDDLEHYQDLDDTVLINKPRWQEDRSARPGRYKEAVYKSPHREERKAPARKEKPKKGMRYLALTAALMLVIFLLFRFAINRNINELDSHTTKVPQVTNISEDEAMKLLKDASLEGKVTSRVYDDKVGAGQVIKQAIGQGTTVDKGTVIQIMVSKGSKNALIPSTAGKTLEDATKALENEGFVAGQTTFEYSDDIEKDKVIGTEPASGESANKQERVNIIVSRGKKDSTTIVPVLLGSTQTEAIKTLKESHLELGSLRAMPSSYPAGTVIKQTIESGEHVAEGTVIDLIISSGSQAASENTVGNVTHNLHLVPPEGQDRFEVTIFDYNTSQDVPIFRKVYLQSDVSSDGAIHDTLDAPKNADLKIFYDGKPAQTEVN